MLWPLGKVRVLLCLSLEATQVAFSLVTGSGSLRGEIPCKGSVRIGAWGGEAQRPVTVASRAQHEQHKGSCQALCLRRCNASSQRSPNTQPKNSRETLEDIQHNTYIFPTGKLRSQQPLFDTEVPTLSKPIDKSTWTWALYSESAINRGKQVGDR